MTGFPVPPGLNTKDCAMCGAKGCTKDKERAGGGSYECAYPAVHALCDRIAKHCIRVCREEIDKPEPTGEV